jgi:hypothetical protein
MSDESSQTWRPTIEGVEGQAGERPLRPGVGIPAVEPAYTRPSTPLRETPILKRMIDAIPPSDKEIHGDVDLGIAAAANGNAMKRSEARRDAILAVSLAIVRRGQNPVTDWTTRDTDTAYAIADMLVALGG